MVSATATKVETKPVRRETAPEAQQIEAVSQLPRDLAVIKMENDNIMSMAAAHPRDYGLVLADIKSQLQHFRQFAENAIYAKPVGRLEQCPKCGTDSRYRDRCPNRDCGADIPNKIARGLSIRAAEALAAAYKYNRVRTDVTDIDADKVRIEATFVDYQAGRLWQDSAVVSKIARKRDGTSYRIPDDRFYNVVVQARKSILVRECICRVVPPGLRIELFEVAEEELGKMLDDTKIKNIINQFAGIKVTVLMLEKLLGKKINVLTIEDRKMLAGIWAAIKDQETTIEEVFGDGAEPKNQADQTAQGIKDALKPKAEEKTPETVKEPEAKPIENLEETRRMCETLVKGDSITKVLKSDLRKLTIDSVPKDASAARWKAELAVLRELAASGDRISDLEALKTKLQEAREKISDAA